MQSESDWIERAKQGDESAFRHLVEQHAARVRAAVLGMLGDTTEADDVAQEVFIRFYRHIDDFRGDAQLGTYLTRIAINLSLNELKRRQRKNRWLTVLQPGGPAGGVADAGADPARMEERDRVLWAIRQLEPDFRAVVLLRLVEGYSVKETAEILGLPQGTVASRLARAQSRLKRKLED